MQRVAITGSGLVSGFGTERKVMQQAIREGRTAIAAPSADSSTAQACPIRSVAVPDFSATPFLKGRKAYLDRASEMAMAGAALALSDAGLEAAHPVDEIGLVLGTMYGNIATMERYYGDILDRGSQAAKPVLFPHLYPNTAASLAAIEFDLGGTHAVFTGSWTSGADALIQAADWIAAGRARTLLAGGVDALHPLVIRGLQAAGLLSPLAGKAGGAEGVYSFDRRANGIIVGEGSGILALESGAHAATRAADIVAELAGGSIGPADSIPEASAIMRTALERAGCSIGDIGWVCAHGMGYARIDAIEAGALAELARARGRVLPVWTPQPLLGETLAAGTGLRTAIAVQLMRDECLPPLPGNLQSIPDYDPIDFVTESRAVERAPVMINSFCVLGRLATIIVKPW